MGKANTDLGIARPDVGVASSVMGFLNPWKELASFQTGIRGSDEQVTKSDQGSSQFREENPHTAEGIWAIPTRGHVTTFVIAVQNGQTKQQFE